jgi:hypothetical protein
MLCILLGTGRESPNRKTKPQWYHEEENRGVKAAEMERHLVSNITINVCVLSINAIDYTSIPN